MGVSVTETTPEIRIATQIVTANSRNNRPRMPPMNSTGMNTAASEMVIEIIVNEISFDPCRPPPWASCPCSMWRTMFSSITIASSTTKPDGQNQRHHRQVVRGCNSAAYITANVPTIENGSAMLGINVAETLRRKRKITLITSASVSIMVN